MRRNRCVLFLLPLTAALAASLPTAAPAQSVYWGAGITLPTGDYGDYAKTGYLGIAGVSFAVGPAGLSVVGEGFYGQNSHDIDGDKTNPYGAMAGLLYDLSPEEMGGVYVFGQAGFMVHKYSSDGPGDSSDTGLGFGGGAGYGFLLGDTEIFAEGRYMYGDFDYGGTSFLGIMVGVALALGGGN
jgi:hypothetical protein